MTAALRVIALVMIAAVVAGRKADHRYERGTELPVYSNKVWPADNLIETYEYHHLPFCAPKGELIHIHTNLGELLEGDRKVQSLITIEFQEEVSKRTKICKKELGIKDIMAFSQAIDQDYKWEIQVDSLPVVGDVGFKAPLEAAPQDTEFDPSGPHRNMLYTYVHYRCFWNEYFVIHCAPEYDRVNGAFDLSHALNGGPRKVEFQYSVSWEETETPFERRLELHHDSTPMRVAWGSIINSLALVLVLLGFLGLIVAQVLDNDYKRYSAVADAEDANRDVDIDEYGWKKLHADVFRFPSQPMIMSALLGNGAQMLVLVLFLLLGGAISYWKPSYVDNGGQVQATALVAYSFTTFVAGYVAARFYTQLGGTNWVWCVLTTMVAFMGPFYSVALFLNVLAALWNSSAALPFGTVFMVVLMWIVVGLPLTVVGAVVGKNTAGEFHAPTRPKRKPREIPQQPWYRHWAVTAIPAGFLPFSAILLELYYIFTGMWGGRSSTWFVVLPVAFALLVLTTASLTVALVYFQLAAEDHRWWWQAWSWGASTGGFIFAYGYWYMENTSAMHGLLQRAFFMGYVGVASYAFALLLGFVGFTASLFFVRAIYSSLKIN